MIMVQGKYDLLMAQMNHKRQLKEQYLRQRQPQPHGQSPLAQQLSVNMVLLSIRERVDIFSVEPEDLGDPINSVFDWLSSVAEKLCCGVYELFLFDETRQKAIVYSLIEELRSFRDWTPTETGFSMAGFGFSPQANGTLSLRKEGKDYLMQLKIAGSPFFPETIPLWKEQQGGLQALLDQLLTPDPLAEQLDTLRHLIMLVQEMPQANIVPILNKTAQALEQIEKQRRQQYQEHKTETGKAALLLLGGAISELKTLSQNPQTPLESLREIVYMPPPSATLPSALRTPILTIPICPPAWFPAMAWVCCSSSSSV